VIDQEMNKTEKPCTSTCFKNFNQDRVSTSVNMEQYPVAFISCNFNILHPYLTIACIFIHLFHNFVYVYVMNWLQTWPICIWEQAASLQTGRPACKLVSWFWYTTSQ